MINLLSLQKKSDVKNLLLLRFVTGLFAAIILASVLLILSLVPMYIYFEKQEATIEAISGALSRNDNFNQIKGVSEKISANNDRLKIFPNDLPKAGYIESLIDRIIQIKGSGVFITAFNYGAPNKSDTKSTNIEIKGVARDRKSLLDFKQKLEAEKSFTAVVLPISSFVKVDNIPFSIRLRTE